MRKRRQNSDSLEMFLDTICNTFGGILFILLFVVIHLQITQKTVSETSDKSVPASQFATIEAEFLNQQEKLQALIDQSDIYKEIAETISDEELQKLFQEWQEKTEQNTRLVEEKSNLATQVADFERRAAENTEKVKDLKEQIESLNTELKKNEKSLEQLKDSNTQDISLPQLHASDKIQFGLVLRFGRLYLWHQYDENGNRHGLNTRDFTVVEEDEYSISVIPNVWCGIDLSEKNVDTKIGDLIRPFSPDKHMAVIVVAQDSFTQYGIVRDYLKKHLFDIYPIPLIPGDSESWIADRGGASNDAQ